MESDALPLRCSDDFKENKISPEISHLSLFPLKWTLEKWRDYLHTRADTVMLVGLNCGSLGREGGFCFAVPPQCE